MGRRAVVAGQLKPMVERRRVLDEWEVDKFREVRWWSVLGSSFECPESAMELPHLRKVGL